MSIKTWRPEREEGVDYRMEWSHREGDSNLNGGGVSFPCDKDGNIDFSDLQPAALENLNKALMGEMHFVGLRAHEWSYQPPRMGRCHCGEEIYLDHFTNECSCGALYNSSGQELCDPRYWGEETGEHPSECW